jgi:flagellar hook-associated protein 2
MNGPIQIGGLATGLDTAAIIQALVGAESIPIQQLEARKSEQKSKLSLLGTLDGLINDLRKKANSFKETIGFVANSVAIGTEGVASFTSSGGSALGSYSLNVEQLASADRYVTTGVPDDTAVLDESISASFSYGGEEYEITLTGEDATLANLATQIEEVTGGEVQASVVNVGASAVPNFKLIVEGSETGADNAIQNFELTTANDVLGIEEQLSSAKNAIIQLNGLEIQRSTNEFSDVVDGLSFTVESVTGDGDPLTDGPGENVEFSVGVDEDGTIEQLKEFTKAYNAVVGFINAQNEYSEDDGAGGPLFGDSILRSIQSTLSGTLSAPGVIDGTSSFGSLGLLGIDLGTDGLLTINESEVKEKLLEDPDAFADFFVDNDGFDNNGAEEGTAGFYTDTTTDSGLFSKLVSRLDQLLDDQEDSNGKKLNGLIDSRKDSLNRSIDDFDDQILRLEDRLLSFEQSLVLQFAALEQLVGNLNSQGAALAAFNA